MKAPLRSAVAFLLAIGLASNVNAGMWLEFDGHWYGLTQDFGTWHEAEAEAVSYRGHLATINNAAEHAWLAETFAGHYRRGFHDSTWNSLVWIGLHNALDHTGNPNADGELRWISGEAVTYLPQKWLTTRGLGTWWKAPQGDQYVYLHTGTHPDPGTVGNIRNTDFDLQPRGIIELNYNPVPEPTSLIVFGTAITGLMGARYRRSRRGQQRKSPLTRKAATGIL